MKFNHRNVNLIIWKHLESKNSIIWKRCVRDIILSRSYIFIISFFFFLQKAAIVKIRSKLNGFVQPVTTLFVGTSPELEMALYTVCFFARPNTACPLSFGGTDFIIIANRVNYFGKDILVSAFPEI